MIIRVSFYSGKACNFPAFFLASPEHRLFLRPLFCPVGLCLEVSIDVFSHFRLSQTACGMEFRQIEKKRGMRRKFTALVFKINLAIVALSSWIAVADETPNEVPRITKKEVRELLVNLNVVITDVRSNEAWDTSELKIKGAVREDPKTVDSWMEKYPKNKILVFY